MTGADPAPPPLSQVADAAPRNWVDAFAPPPARPYLRLARLDRPIGTWLLLWPCWWSIAFATAAQGGVWPDVRLMALFGLGAIVMRGAGCTYNDMVDRNFDGRVARTASRPLPSGAVSLKGAAAFLILQCLIGLGVLLSLNETSIWLGAVALVPVAIYPFLKRFTHWPQVGLGLAFNWGALLGWTAVTGHFAWPMASLYLAGIAWTLGYDTIYAHQDKEDDALVGLKSSALKLGDRTRPWLFVFYGVALAGLALTGLLAGIGWFFYVGLMAAAWHLVRQTVRVDLDDPDQCLAIFRSNRDFGFIVFGAILAGLLGPSV